MLEAAGLSDATLGRLMRDRPGRTLMDAARNADPERAVLSEYHAVGCRRGYYMLRYRRWKYVHYVDAPAQLFDLESDPTEEPRFHL